MGDQQAGKGQSKVSYSTVITSNHTKPEVSMHLGSSKARISQDVWLPYKGQFQKKLTVSHVRNEVTTEPTYTGCST
jgi:hypothetical protein